MVGFKSEKVKKKKKRFYIYIYVILNRDESGHISRLCGSSNAEGKGCGCRGAEGTEKIVITVLPLESCCPVKVISP